jgi:hypothetical protein
MPRYTFRRYWSETNGYSDTVEIEADDEDTAREEAREAELDYSGGSDSSEYIEDSLDIELDHVEGEDPEIEPTPKKKVSKYKRNIPEWF